MRNHYKITIACLLVVLLCGCDDAFDCTRGEGPIVTRTLSLASFSSLELSGSDKLYIRQGPEQEVIVEGQDNIINMLNQDVKNGHWDIKTSGCTRKHEELVFYVTMPEISSLTISGSGNIIGENLLESESIHLKISGSGAIQAEVNAGLVKSEIAGSGNINLRGLGTNGEVKITGSGKYNAFDLPLNSYKVEIEGSGDADIQVTEHLEVKISGSGDVNYIGNPSLNSKINGSGQIRKI